MKKLVLVGVGNAALAVNEAASDYDTKYGTTRSSEKCGQLREIALTPIVLSETLSPDSLEELERASLDADVLVSFPPHPESDRLLAEAVRQAKRIVYVSSTAVYGARSGVVTEDSQVCPESPPARLRLDAEETWLARKAIVLRAPALYGPNYGLHLSLKSGKYRIAGDGNRYSSRIHLHDLAHVVLASFARALPGSIYVVGDLTPARQLEVVTWLCSRLGLPMPASIPLEEAHYTQRADRQVRPDRVLNDLSISLRYPSYKDGFEQCLANM